MTNSRWDSAVSKSEYKKPTTSLKTSPLRQVNGQQVNGEPVQHKLKVAALYESLFQDKEHLPGYWVELFLLPVNSKDLSKVIESQANFSNDEDLVIIQTLVKASLANLSADLPEDIISNALKVLETVITVIIDLSNKSKLPTPSIIHILTGLEYASTTFDDLCRSVLSLLANPNRSIVSKATEFVLHVSKATWGTQLRSLFSTKNYFAAFINIIDTKIDDVAVNAFCCIGILTALDIYDEDSASLYLQRISDYVDESVMTKFLAMLQRELGNVSSFSSQQNSGLLGWMFSFFDNHDNQPSESTTQASTSIKSSISTTSNVVLTLYFFVLHNTIFASQFASSPALATLLELTVDYITSMKAPVATSHSWLVILLLRHIVDTEFTTLIDPSRQMLIKLKTSKLDLDKSLRVPMAGILDSNIILLRTGCVQKKPDWALLEQAANLIYQVFAHMAITKSIWHYNWMQLWENIVYVIKALTMRASHLSEADQLAKSTIAANNKASKSIEMVVNRLIVYLVSMCLRRDLLDEGDWSFLLFSIVQNQPLFQKVISTFPDLNHNQSLTVIKAMTSQYELNKDQPELTVILKQGKLAAGTLLAGEKLRPFSTHREPIVKWAVRQEILN